MRALKLVLGAPLLFSLVILPVLSSFFAAPSFATVLPFTTWVSTESDGKVTEVELSQGTDSLGTTGNYMFTFDVKRGPKNTHTGDITLLIGIERDRCAEGNGQSRLQSTRYVVPDSWGDRFCFTPWEPDEYKLITLNPANNFTQRVSATTSQIGNVSCGSFQTDVYYMALNGSDVYTLTNTAGSNLNTATATNKRVGPYYLSYEGKNYPNALISAPASSTFTGKDLGTCTTVSPSPTPGVSPSPSPTSSPKVSVPPIQPETGLGILGASIIFGGGPLGYFLLRHRRHHKAIIHEEPQELNETAQDIIEGREEKKDTTTGTGQS